MKDVLQIMSTREGHREELYDPTNKEQTNKIKKLIREKLRDGYYLYAHDKETNLFETIQNEKDITNENLDRFILTKKYKKKLLSKPVVGG